MQPRVATTCFALIILLAAAVAPAQQASWVNQGRDGVSQTSYFHLPSTTDSSTGISFHRSHASCRFNDVRLVDPPTWLEMFKYNGDAKDGRPGTRFTVRMERGHADDRSLRLSFKAGSTMPTGPHTLTLAAERHRTSPGCAGAAAAALTLTYTVSIFDSISWTAQGLQNYEFGDNYRIDELGGLALDTGLRFHRRPNLCSRTDMSLVGGTEDYLELRAYRADDAIRRVAGVTLINGIFRSTTHALVLNSGRQLGAGGTRLTNVVMDRNSPNDSYVRLFHKASVAVTEAMEITVSVAFETSRSCGFPATVRKQTLDFMRQEVLPAPAQYQATWRSGSENLTPAGPFSPVRIFNNRLQRTPTGIVLNRSSSLCPRSTRGLLLNHTDKFDFYSGDGTRNNGDNLLQGTTGRSSDSHSLDWFLDTNLATPTAGSVLRLSVLLRSNTFFCPNDRIAPAQTLVFALTIATPASWSALAGDATRQAMLLQPSQIRASTTPTDTGIRFHRGTSACPLVDLNLSPNPHVEMRLYNGISTCGLGDRFRSTNGQAEVPRWKRIPVSVGVVDALICDGWSSIACRRRSGRPPRLRTPGYASTAAPPPAH